MGKPYIVLGAGSIGRRHYDNLTILGADARLVPWREAGDLSVLDGAAGAVIATATNVRTKPIAACAARGIPMYIEKPLAYRATDVTALMDVVQPVASRSVAGFMMRYHPAFLSLIEEPIDAFGFHLEIGHDVRQWRQNWRFADSYAANPEGGGVLLDLCHEIDMAACLFPGLKITAVNATGHDDFPGVDFATRISLTNGSSTGEVVMDYLTPAGVRHIALRGRKEALDLDLLACQAKRWSADSTGNQSWQFERNDMFLALMRDFMALVEGREPSDNPLLPRLDRVAESAALIAQAWEARTFHGTIAGGFE